VASVLSVVRKLSLPLPAEDSLEYGFFRRGLLLESDSDPLIFSTGHREALAGVLVAFLNEGQFVHDSGPEAQLERRPPEDAILELDHSALGLALDVDRDALGECALWLGPLGGWRLDWLFALVFAENLIRGGWLAVLEQSLFIVF
jgi:hypothetical protein